MQQNVPWSKLWSVKWHPRYGILLPLLAASTFGLTPAIFITFYLTRSASKAKKSACQIKNDLINLGADDEVGPLVPVRWTEESSAAYVNAVLSRSALWTINLVFGDYSLSTAKAIHASWDVVVGRGGQALLSFAWYRVASNLVVTMAEESPVPHGLFAAVTISGSNMWSFWHGASLLVSRQWIEHRHVVMAMVAATLWIISWPTIMSLLTGYASLTEPFVKLRGGSLAKFQEFEESYDKHRVLVIIDSYGTLGLYANYTVENSTDPMLYRAYSLCRSLTFPVLSQS